MSRPLWFGRVGVRNPLIAQSLWKLATGQRTAPDPGATMLMLTDAELLDASEAAARAAAAAASSAFFFSISSGVVAE